MKPVISNGSFRRKYVMPYQKTLDYLTTPFNVFNVSEGTVRSGKTTDQDISFCDFVDNSPDELFLAVAQTNATAQTILIDGDGLGIKHYPDWQEATFIKDGKKVKRRQRIFEGKYKGNDALILLPKKGSGHPIKYIVPFGGLNANSHEIYKGWSVGGWIATQWELLHSNTRNELLKRTIASRDRKHFIDLNPTSPEHEIYKQFERWEKEGKLKYIHKTLRDNPILTEERIQEIMMEYDPESIDYQRDILGKRVAANGQIYNVRDYNIINSFNPNDHSRYVVVADLGETMSATVFILLALRKGNLGVDVLHEYWHRNADEKGMGVKQPDDYAKDFIEFINECERIMGFSAYDIITDWDTIFRREFDRVKKSYNYGRNLSPAIKDEIDKRIKTGIQYLWKERLRFYSKCDKTIHSFKTATYDAKKQDRGVYERYDAPHQGTMIDCVDAVEYGFTAFEYELSRSV